ncbi:MAG: nucleoside triphosphate pyrophosphohydrolase [Granulosicoccus sp.]
MKTPIDQLRNIMRRLRDPDTGCAWDIKQDFASIAAFTLEEAYEVVDAIERGDTEDLKDELGDLLLQVVFHAQMASEQNLFDFDDVAQAISDKMLRRHPHVFGDVSFSSEAELKASWELIKAEERRAKLTRKPHSPDPAGRSESAPVSALDGVAPNLPALKRADKIQKRAARVGFDWPDISPVWDKLAEEITEVREAVAAQDDDAIMDEIGDLLFTVVNLARHTGVDSESAMRQASAKFEKRFRHVEALALEEGKALKGMDLPGLDALWDRAKRKD